MTNRAIAHARLRNSRLVGPSLATAQEVVRWFGAVQSQDVPGAMWAVAQRMARSTTVDDLGSAYDICEVVRTHAMRPTWHFVAPDELRWIQALTADRVHRTSGTLYRRFGLDDAVFARAEGAMRSALSGGRSLTREQLRGPVQAAGIALPENLMMTCLVMHAELACVICNGPRAGRQLPYALVDDRVPPAPVRDRDDALRDLTIRYFTSHGPALVHDMSWWSGLTVTDVRRGLDLAGTALDGRTIDGKAYWAATGAFDPADVPTPFVRLLSNYDEYLGSYSDYSPITDPSLPKARDVSDVLGSHIVVRDGFVVGGWRRAIERDRVGVKVTLLMPLTAAEGVALEEQADAFGRFFGLPAELTVERE